MHLVEQELPTLPEQMSSRRFPVSQSLVFCVVFSFGHCAVSPSLCYLQTFLIHAIAWFRLCKRGRRGRDRMTFGFATTYAFSTYHH